MCEDAGQEKVKLFIEIIMAIQITASVKHILLYKTKHIVGYTTA